MSDHAEQTPILERFHERLVELGLKSTRQRDVIVETFFRLDRHISVEELLEEVRKEFPRIGYATVYRTMKLLEENRFADARQFGDGQTRYDPKVDADEQHDHLICVDCRRVIEFADPVVEARIAQIASEFGAFVLTRRSIELYARCKDTACPHRARIKE